MGSGIGAPYVQVAVRIEFGHNRIRLGLKIGFLGSGKCVFPDIVGFGKAFFHIAHVDRHMDVDVLGKIVVNQRRIRRHGCHGIENRRQFFICHLNQTERRKGRFFVHSRHGRHFFAEVADLFGGQKLLIHGVSENTPFAASGVFACHHGFDAG